MSKENDEYTFETVSTNNIDKITESEFLIGDKWKGVVAEFNSNDMGIPCPKCNVIGDNPFLLLDNGEHLYIAKCCGVFAYCKVTGEDNGMATE
jgi:hypothetical protein